MARAHRFEHVRIQTHGMGMDDMDYCRELVDAGVDQYFVSVTGVGRRDPRRDHRDDGFVRSDAAGVGEP